MGLIINKETNRNSSLNERITADLRERIQSQQQPLDAERTFARSQPSRKTSRFAWVWCLLIVGALASLYIIIV